MIDILEKKEEKANWSSALTTKKAEFAQQSLFSVFEDRLPNKPYCTRAKGESLRIRPKKTAMAHPLIQYNAPALVSWLCFDLDYAYLREGVKNDECIPSPTFTVENPLNGHCHVYYGLLTPVCRTDSARQKPLRLLAIVEEALRLKLGADQGFAGLIGKMPHHQKWRTIEASKTIDCLYELGEFAEWVKLPKTLPKRLGIRTGLGRNIELFDRLRLWAYKWKADFLEHKNFNLWCSAVLNQCEKYNDFASPLPLSEVKSISKSVSAWTWKKYTGRMDDKDFSKLQAIRGSRGGKKKIGKTKLKIEVKGVL